MTDWCFGWHIRFVNHRQEKENKKNAFKSFPFRVLLELWQADILPVGSSTDALRRKAIALDSLFIFNLRFILGIRPLAIEVQAILGLALRPYEANPLKILDSSCLKAFLQGVTLTAPVFYAPGQGREVRLSLEFGGMMDKLAKSELSTGKDSLISKWNAGWLWLGELPWHKNVKFRMRLWQIGWLQEFDKKGWKKP